MIRRKFRKMKIIFLVMIVVGCGGLVCTFVEAATYYVSPDGSDSNPGTQSQPWLTLQHSANNVQAGDTVLVNDGTYVGFRTSNSGTADNPIVFRANGDNVLINSGYAGFRDNIEINGEDYVVIDGFRIEEAIRAGIAVLEARGVTIQNCIANHNLHWGIFTGFTPEIKILNNIASNTQDGPDSEHGIYVSNSDVPDDNPIIRGNISFNNNRNGIQINGDLTSGGDGIITGAILEDNIVYGNNWKGLSLISMADSVVRNNLIYENGLGAGAGGVHLAEEPGTGMPSSNNLIVNNTINEPRIAGIRITNGVGNVIFNNIVISGRDTIVDESGGNYIDTTSNIEAGSTAGLFVDSSTGDYHLADGSPAIDAGRATYEGQPAAVVDIEGNPRPQGDGYDIGVYESAGAQDTTPPVISGVASSNVTDVSAVISWATNEPSDSLVEYGLTTTYGYTAQDGLFVTTHELTLTNLTAETLYHYRVASRDSSSNSSTSTDYTFTTGQAGYSAIFSDIPVFGDTNNWTPVTAGYWEVVDDPLTGDRAYFLNDTARGGYEYTLFSMGSYGDFTLTARARTAEPASNGYRDYIIIFGYQDPQNYYYAFFNGLDDATTNGIMKREGGIITKLSAMGLPPTITDEEYHTIEITRTGANITVSIDGVTTFTASDSSFGAGRIGLGSFNDSAYFDDVNVSAEVVPNDSPVITSGPTAMPEIIDEGQTAMVTVEASDPNVGDILYYNWSTTGGSITGTGAEVTYSTGDVEVESIYTIRVIVTDGRGGETQGSTDITVNPVIAGNVPPIALAQANRISGEVPLNINFTGSGSSDPDGNIVLYAWTFGDGAISNEQNPTHIYNSAATYTVTLTVTDNDGAAGSDSLTIIVTPPISDDTMVLQNGLNGYNGVEDGFIRARDAGATYNTDSLSIKYNHGGTTGFNDKTLIKFDISPLLGRAVQGGKLTLYRTAPANLTDRLEIWSTKSNWNESTLTWGNSPDTERLLLFQDISPQINTWVEIDLTEIIPEVLREQPPVLSLNIGSTVHTEYDEDNTIFVSSEYADSTLGPKLIVSYLPGAPFAHAGLDQQINLGDIVTLDGTASSDPNESQEDLIYTWSILKKPYSSTLSNNDIQPNNNTGANGGDTPTFSADVSGLYKLQLTVTNVSGLSNSDIVEIMVFYIRSEHPRVWLTPEYVVELRDRADANTPEWQRFIALVNSGGDSGSSYVYTATNIEVFGLAYQVTGNTAYADTCKEKMYELSSFDMTGGYEGGRGEYYSRSFAVAMALGFDWIHDQLSQAERDYFIGIMNTWRDVYLGPGAWPGLKPGNNFYTGHFIAEGITGLATYGDNLRAQEFIDHARFEMYEKHIKTYIQTKGKGGIWPEGFNYGEANSRHVFGYFEAVKTATGENLYRDTEFAKDAIYGMIYRMLPNEVQVVAYGDGGGEPSGLIIDSHRRTMLFLGKEFEDDVAGQYAQYWLSHIYPYAQMDNDRYYHLDFLFYNPNAPERDYKTELPLSYYAPGTGIVTTRSSWNNDATFVSLKSSARYEGHGHADEASFTVFRQEWLLPEVGGPTNANHTFFHNTFLINGGGQTHGDSVRQHGSIQKYETNTNYVYALAEASGIYGASNAPLLNILDRELVFLPPDYVVIFDRVETTVPTYSKEWLSHFWGAPTVSGDLTSSTHGTGKVFVKTLLPEAGNLTIETVNEGNVNNWFNHWRIEVQPNVLQAYDQFLHVIHPTLSTTALMPATIKIDSLGNNMVGAKIGNQIALFSNDYSKPQLDEPITYTVSGQGTSKHLIVDLKPNTTFTITNTNLDTNTQVSQETKVSSNLGTLYFETILSSTHQITITPGGQVPVVRGDVNGDGQVNVVDVQLAVNQFLGVAPETQEADLNGDGVVNVIDVQLLVNIILSLAT